MHREAAQILFSDIHEVLEVVNLLVKDRDIRLEFNICFCCCVRDASILFTVEKMWRIISSVDSSGDAIVKDTKRMHNYNFHSCQIICVPYSSTRLTLGRGGG